MGEHHQLPGSPPLVPRAHRLLRLGACDSALAAAEFAALLARGFCSVAEALDAAGRDVTFLGAAVCDSALAAALFAFLLAFGFLIVADARDAARLPVSFDSWPPGSRSARRYARSPHARVPARRSG